MEKGDKVKYYSYKGAKPERGIVKSLCDDPSYVFVVFHCAGEWANYEAYTGQMTPVNKLILVKKPDLSDANGKQYDFLINESLAWREFEEDMQFFGEET